MSWYKSKVKLLRPDTIFSRIVRTRDGWRCKYRFKCLGAEDYRLNPQGLDNSHFQKRGKWTTRFDLENCDAACKKCHHFVENDPNGQKVLEEWKLAQLGQKRYNLLIIRANQTGHRDDAAALLFVRGLEKELREKGII